MKLILDSITDAELFNLVVSQRAPVPHTYPTNPEYFNPTPPPPVAFTGLQAPVSQPQFALTPPPAPIVPPGLEVGGTLPNTPKVTPAVDKNGLQWDARIHAGTKVFNVDGTWRARRNLDPVFYDSVMTELTRAKGGAPAVPAPPVAALASAPPPVASAPVPPPPPPGALTLTQLLSRLATAMDGGKVTEAHIIEACKMSQITGLMDLNAHPELIPNVLARIELLAGTSI